jgi:peptide-methionine (R)-S-oxide reductase
MNSNSLNRRTVIGGLLLGAATLALSGREAFAYAVTKSDEDWKKQLSPQAYDVLRHEGTEYPFSSPLDKNFRKGTYSCAGCDLANFSSETKFDSHTGWPSFWKPLSGAVLTREDDSSGDVRTEVHCSRCGGHLGHVFDDGPRPTGLRYCMNGVALTFKAA